MADMYSVRTNGSVFYVYRNDGNVSVGEFYNASEAQIAAARMNQQYNEKFGKKKEESVEPEAPSETASEEETKPEEAPAEQPQEPPKAPAKAKKSKAETPDPPPGQGTSY